MCLCYRNTKIRHIQTMPKLHKVEMVHIEYDDKVTVVCEFPWYNPPHVSGGGRLYKENPPHVSGYLAQERLAQERLAQERLAQERLAQERLAQERLAQERLAQERLAQERLAQERLAQLQKQLKESQEKERVISAALEKSLYKIEKLIRTINYQKFNNFLILRKHASDIYKNNEYYCSICTFSFSETPDESIALLCTCQHVFHVDCLEKCIQTIRENNYCPNCNNHIET
jgi:hypothetical protein